MCLVFVYVKACLGKLRLVEKMEKFFGFVYFIFLHENVVCQNTDSGIWVVSFILNKKKKKKETSTGDNINV